MNSAVLKWEQTQEEYILPHDVIPDDDVVTSGRPRAEKTPVQVRRDGRRVLTVENRLVVPVRLHQAKPNDRPAIKVTLCPGKEKSSQQATELKSVLDLSESDRTRRNQRSHPNVQQTQCVPLPVCLPTPLENKTQLCKEQCAKSVPALDLTRTKKKATFGNSSLTPPSSRSTSNDEASAPPTSGLSTAEEPENPRVKHSPNAVSLSVQMSFARRAHPKETVPKQRSSGRNEDLPSELRRLLVVSEHQANTNTPCANPPACSKEVFLAALSLVDVCSAEECANAKPAVSSRATAVPKVYNPSSGLTLSAYFNSGSTPDYYCTSLSYPRNPIHYCGDSIIYTSRTSSYASPPQEHKRYKCPACGKAFAVPSKLKLHYYVHVGFRPHKCRLCEKSFTKMNDLTVHYRSHTGEKPFACELCAKAFASTRRLKEHALYVHTGVRPHKCTLCDKAFAKRHALKCHMRTHTGEKPYQCHVCNTKFSSTRSLKRHYNTHAVGAAKSTKKSM